MATTIDIFASATAGDVISSLDRTNEARGSATFPRYRNDLTDLRIGDAESLHQWFVRSLGTENPDTRMRACSVEENFAFLGKVVWDGDDLIYCNFQALITQGCDLETFYLEHQQPRQEQHEATYYRFDLDLVAIGPLFAEPQPHVHCLPDGPPRFPLVFDDREYCLISFLEFVYRNHFHEQWLKWVKAVTAPSFSSDQINEIIDAFKDGTLETHLGRLSPHIHNLKEILRQQKREKAPDHLRLPAICTATAY